MGLLNSALIGTGSYAPEKILTNGERIGLPEEKMFVNVDKYGNTSSATMAVALDEVVRTGRVGPGDIILIVAFGSGLTWAATAIRL